MLSVKVAVTPKFVLVTYLWPPSLPLSFTPSPVPLQSIKEGMWLHMQLLVPNQPSDGEILSLLCSNQLRKVATKNPQAGGSFLMLWGNQILEVK